MRYSGIFSSSGSMYRMLSSHVPTIFSNTGKAEAATGEREARRAGGRARRSGATRATRPAAAIDIVDVGGLVC